MAWTTTKTDWSELDRCTYADVNRIAGNINYLCGTSLKANFTQDDVLSRTRWTAMITALDTKAAAVRYTPEAVPNTDATAMNFNTMEEYILGLKNWIDLLAHQESARIYSGEGIRLGDNQFVR